MEGMWKNIIIVISKDFSTIFVEMLSKQFSVISVSLEFDIWT